MGRGRRERAWEDAVERSIVWLFAAPRSGTTWLQGLLVAHPRAYRIDEPLIGLHLGIPAVAATGAAAGPGSRGLERVIDVAADRRDYFFATRYRDAWAPALRTLLIRRFGAQLVEAGGQPGRDACVIKEPHGTEVADVLASVLPLSRVLVVVRDGRDAVDSALDSMQPGAWGSWVAVMDPADEDARRRAITELAGQWAHRTKIAMAAYDAHVPDRRRLVRYEDLLEDTTAVLADVVTWLGLEAFGDLADVVARRAFAAIPEAERGAGRFARAASPGLWRTRFNADERALLADLIGDDLRSLGYEA